MDVADVGKFAEQCQTLEVERDALRARVQELETSLEAAFLIRDGKTKIIAHLEATLESYRQDAERYRWRRAQEILHDKKVFISLEPRTPDEFDAAIDAARQESKP